MQMSTSIARKLQTLAMHEQSCMEIEYKGVGNKTSWRVHPAQPELDDSAVRRRDGEGVVVSTTKIPQPYAVARFSMGIIVVA